MIVTLYIISDKLRILREKDLYRLFSVALFLLGAGETRLRQTIDNCHNEIGDHGKDKELEYLAKGIATLFALSGSEFCTLFSEKGLNWIGDMNANNGN